MGNTGIYEATSLLGYLRAFFSEGGYVIVSNGAATAGLKEEGALSEITETNGIIKIIAVHFIDETVRNERKITLLCYLPFSNAEHQTHSFNPACYTTTVLSSLISQLFSILPFAMQMMNHFFQNKWSTESVSK